jgi:hypothetical protein
LEDLLQLTHLYAERDRRSREGGDAVARAVLGLAAAKPA